jgi:hypothetical protein
MINEFLAKKIQANLYAPKLEASIGMLAKEVLLKMRL